LENPLHKSSSALGSIYTTSVHLATAVFFLLLIAAMVFCVVSHLADILGFFSHLFSAKPAAEVLKMLRKIISGGQSGGCE